MKNSYIWVGSRVAEAHNDTLFGGMIVLFGKGDNVTSYETEHGYRINYARRFDDARRFQLTQMLRYISRDKGLRFMHYTPNKVYDMPAGIIAHSICINDEALVRQLDDKAGSRRWLGDSVDYLPYYTTGAQGLTFADIQSRFPGYRRYVIQQLFSQGGGGTFLIGSQAQLARLRGSGQPLAGSAEVLVTPCAENCTTLSAHMIIYEKESVLFPLSVQLDTWDSEGNLCYRGADFIAYTRLSAVIRKAAEAQIHTIAEKMRRDGYRGVAGVDLLVSENRVYYVEINPRFLSSSALVNHALRRRGLPLLQKMNRHAFTAPAPDYTLSGFEVPYSFFKYVAGDADVDTVFHKQKDNKNIELWSDGYTPGARAEPGAHAYSLVFPYEIYTHINGRQT